MRRDPWVSAGRVFLDRIIQIIDHSQGFPARNKILDTLANSQTLPCFVQTTTCVRKELRMNDASPVLFAPPCLFT